VARIRTIKPETFTSESIAALSLAARWTFVGLWTYVDDEGRAKDNSKIIRGAIWPNDEETVSSRDVENQLNELDESDMVCRYTGDDGGKYLHVVNFRKHQVINRASKSRIPPCPFHDAEHTKQVNTLPPQGAATDSSAMPQTETPEDSDMTHVRLSELSVPDLGSRNRDLGSGTGNGHPPDAMTPEPLPRAALAEPPPPKPGFDDFWPLWPRKVKKADAQRAWEKAVGKKHADPVVIVEACAAYAARCGATGQDPNFIPYPATWLNGEQWNDDLDAVMPLRRQNSYQPYQNPTDPGAYSGGIR
jgi:hypothetical protein